MDAAVLLWTDTDRRRMRMGELSNATRTTTRKIRKPDDLTNTDEADEGAHTEESHGQSQGQGQETDAQSKARVQREKTQWREDERRRQSFQQELVQRMGQTSTLAAQNGIPQLTALYKQQKEMRKVQMENENTTSDVQTQLAGTAAQIQSLMGEANNQSVPWEYRRGVLNRARLAVSDHLAALHQIQDVYYDKFAEFAGNSELQASIENKVSELDQRRSFMEEYYSVLSKLASGDMSDTGGLDRVSGGATNIAPEIVQNSSTMRLLARRRRNFWAEIA